MKFFFYGTLSHSLKNEMTMKLRGKLSPGKPATVSGQLYAIPDSRGFYPALIRAGKENATVHGYIYRVTPKFTLDDLAEIDLYEEYFPNDLANSEYKRLTIQAKNANQKIERVQTYLYNRPLPRDAIALSHGDFLRFLKDQKVDAFGK